MAENKDLVLMAEIVGVHGIKGWVKLNFMGDDPKLLTKLALTDAQGGPLPKVVKLNLHGNIHIAELENLSDRTAAEKLRGTKFYAARDALPKIRKKDTYYHADLIGLAAWHVDGHEMGKVIAVANFGAGDLLDIKPARGASFYIPFTNDAVPDVDIEAGRVTIDPPPGLLD